MSRELAIAAYAADAQWAAVVAGWASVMANLAVVITALLVPYVLRRLDDRKTQSTNASALRTGLIALGMIGQTAEWIERAANAHSRTVQDHQLTLLRQLAGTRHAVEISLSPSLEDASVRSFLAEVLMLVREAEDALRKLPKNVVPDGVGVEVLTPSRISSLDQVRRSLSEMDEHRHFALQQGESLMGLFEEKNGMRTVPAD